MQYRLPRPSRLTDALHRWALRRGFPTLARIAPRWPRWWLLLNARWVIFLVMAVYPRPKRAIAGNLARILGASRRSWRVRRGVSRTLRHFAYYWVDLFRFAQLPAEEGRRLLAGVEGMEGLEAVLAQGRGAILLTAHLGNWELGGILLGQRDLPVSIVYVPDRYADAERFRSQLRRRAGVEEIAIQPGRSWSSLPVLRALRAGGVVAMQGDRDFDGRGVAAPFFGQPVPFPRGPFLVSLLTGAPLVPTFLTYTESYRFRATFGEPIVLAEGREREAALAGGVAAWVRQLEAAVRRCPDQWYTFFDYWADPPGSGEVAAVAPAAAEAGAETVAMAPDAARGR
ncbi:MAG TPA: lysophospholipid acyltransferase family protein [Thermoanaerobaculia bacterium]|nr:lysophospholipid acyltransferase family protein [Thermoanaerobaculia bacterium]